MAYTRRRSEWKDYPDTTTPIRADDLNGIEAGLSAAAGIADTALATASTASTRAEQAITASSSAQTSADTAQSAADAAFALASIAPEPAIDAYVGPGASGLVTKVNDRAIRVADYGLLGTADDSTTIQAALDAANGRHLIFPPGATLNTGNVQVRNLSNAIIDGNGSTLVLPATGTRIGIQTSGTLDTVTITGFTIKGNGVVGDAHAGIWNNSGTILKNVQYVGNKVRDCTLGISVNADTAGSIDGALVAFNDIDNIVGTASGNGYGIHHASGSSTPAGVRIVNNIIRRAQRHSIYQAKGVGTVISGNQILSHRQGVGDGTVRAALNLLRSTDTTIVGNYINGAFGGAMNIACDTGDTTGVVCSGNVLTDPADTLALIHVGDGLGSFAVKDVSITGNVLRTLQAGRVVKIIQGLGVLVSGNRLTLDNATGASAVELTGALDTAGTNTYSDRIVFLSNVIRMTGSASHRAFRFSGIETSTAILRFDSNVITGAATDFIPAVAMTNPNVTVMGQGMSGLSFSSGIRLAPAPGNPVQFMPNVAAPTDTPTAGAYFYTEGGVVKAKGSSGAVFDTTKRTVTGSRGGNAALASLLTALASTGLITDSSTA